jgi:perosamine synthetase
MGPMGYLAPAGTAMHLGDVLGGYARGLATSAGDAALGAELARRSGVAHAWPLSSGRAAMTVLLRAMAAARAEPARNEVIVPAYTCYSVPASIERAGLVPRLCDIDPETYGLDPGALQRCDFSRVLAVVTANLYGIPNALTAIEGIARERGVYLLDDGAQALGASCDGRAVGTFGDAGLYSFDKGKIICTIQGGAMVTRATRGPLFEAIGAEARRLPAPTAGESLSNAIKLPIYVLGLHPTVYGQIRKLPFLGLGRTDYQPQYPIARLGRLQVGVARRLLPHVDRLNRQRRANAAQLSQALQGLPGMVLPRLAAGVEPVYARFPLRVPDPAARVRLIEALDGAGIGATASYPQALADVPEVAARLSAANREMPGARTLAAQIVTLPTHGHCPADLGARVRQIAERVLR